MKATATLIDRQQAAINAILALRPAGRRAMSYGCALLGKNGRSIAAIRKDFEKHAARMGYTPEQIAQQWQDVKDMAELEHAAN